MIKIVGAYPRVRPFYINVRYTLRAHTGVRPYTLIGLYGNVRSSIVNREMVKSQMDLTI